MPRRVLPAIAALLLVVAGGVGCRSDGNDTVAGSASCAAAVRYGGHLYLGHHVATPPAEGEALGRGALPPCDDTGRSMVGEPPELVELVALEGVPSAIAVIRRGDDSIVYVREGVKLADLPAALAEAVRPLTCRPADEPIRFVALMVGISPVDLRRERDRRAPFDLRVRVLTSSAPRYERGSLRVRVPVELGRPLARADLDALWAGARLSLTVHCHKSGYVADRVTLRRR
jgi:Family of unknown function (DUF6281)